MVNGRWLLCRDVEQIQSAHRASTRESAGSLPLGMGVSEDRHTFRTGSSPDCS